MVVLALDRGTFDVLYRDEPRVATGPAPGAVHDPQRPGSCPPPRSRAPIAHAFQLALATQLARDFRQLDRRVRERMRAK